MKVEKVINFKKWYIQINIDNFGLGFAFDKRGGAIIILFLYVGFHKKY